MCCGCGSGELGDGVEAMTHASAHHHPSALPVCRAFSDAPTVRYGSRLPERKLNLSTPRAASRGRTNARFWFTPCHVDRGVGGVVASNSDPLPGNRRTGGPDFPLSSGKRPRLEGRLLTATFFRTNVADILTLSVRNVLRTTAGLPKCYSHYPMKSELRQPSCRHPSTFGNIFVKAPVS